MAKLTFNDPQGGKPFTSGIGMTAGSGARLGNTKLPAPPHASLAHAAPLARLAAAISRLPSSGGRGNASDLFLP